MPETSSPPPQAISDLTGTWTLDPNRSTIEFRTKAMWILTVNGTLRVTEGSGTVDGDGRVTGRLVVDANSIDTKNKRRDEHLRTADFFEVQNYPIMVFDVTGRSSWYPRTKHGKWQPLYPRREPARRVSSCSPDGRRRSHHT